MEKGINNIENDEISNIWIYIFLIIIVVVFSLSFYFNNIKEKELSLTCERCYGSEWNTTVSEVSRGVYQFLCTNTKTLEWKYGSSKCYNHE